MSRTSSSPPLSWQGIANTQADTDAFRVWLWRPGAAPSDTHSNTHNNNNNNNDKTPWQPFRHVDCQALRQSVRHGSSATSRSAPSSSPLVHIEGGRATADPVAQRIFENFVRCTAPRELGDAVWFVVEEKDGAAAKKKKSSSTATADRGKNAILWPILQRDDEDKIEALYQNTVLLLNEYTDSTTTDDPRDIPDVSPTVTLSNQATVRVVVQNGRDIFLRQTAPGWFGHTQRLQRGYGPYTVPGEAEEEALGPVRSLAIVVHGIGEKYFTSSSSGSTSFPSLLEQTQTMRVALQKQQLQAYEEACAVARKAGQPVPDPPGRMELLPIEWFEALHNDQSEVMQSLQDVTLPSIPALRTIANDIIFDVLVYLTPTFCQAVLEKVHQQITTLYQAFCQVHAGFDGPVTLMGHSLGSVIVWDLLSLHRDPGTAVSATDAPMSRSNSPWGPSVHNDSQLKDPLPFDVDTCVFLGSPIGMFLSMRGARSAFDELRRQGQSTASSSSSEIPKISPFTLPVKRLVNIFNVSDPVAYRIEPLLLPAGTADIPSPAYLTAPGKDVRLHVKARQLGDGVRKALMEPTSAWSAVLGAVAAAAIVDSSETGREPGADGASQTLWKFPLGGASDRVDYALQPALVDNEYISAVLAHSTTGYLLNSDFLAFLVHPMGA